MTPERPLRRISRSAIDAFDSCPRAAYYKYAYGTAGLDRPFNEDLAIGVAVHAGLAVLLLGGAERSDGPAESRRVWLDGLSGNTETADLRSASTLSTALVEGWARARLEAFLRDYEVLEVEKEHVVPLSPNLDLYARADAVVRERSTGLLFVINFKTSDNKKDWTLKWQHDVQAWTEALAMEHILKEPVAGCIFEGLYKGGRYGGAWTSPLVRAFQSPDGDWSWERKAGWTARSVESFPGGLSAWIDFLPLDVLEDQFMTSAPVIKQNDITEDWLRQRIRYFTDAQRMLEPDVEEKDRLLFFEQKFGWKCRSCPFEKVCFEKLPIEDLVESGLLKKGCLR
jgi:CRISPR/Cas system-associated exonuclease Cas4 (RecB family)